VVMSIVSLLMAILLPALGAAREQARKMVCASQLRQTNLIQNVYTNDHRGWYPMVQGHAASHTAPSGFVWNPSHVNPTATNTWTISLTYSGNRSPIESYFGGGGWKMLRCPNHDTTMHSYTGYQAAGGWGLTYYAIAGMGYNLDKASYSDDVHFNGRIFFGRRIRNGSTQEDPSLRTVIPNVEFAGRTVSGYGKLTDGYGPLYIDVAARQPALLEAFNNTGYGRQYLLHGVGAGTYRAPQHHRDGGNVVFVDGHGEYRRTDEVSQSIWSTNTSINFEW